MEQWQLESGSELPVRHSKSFAPFETRPPLLSSATRRRITYDGDLPKSLGCAKLRGTRVHPAFGSSYFVLPLYLFGPHPRYADPGSRTYIQDS